MRGSLLKEQDADAERSGRDGHHLGWLKSVLLKDCGPSGLLQSLTTQSASFNIPAKQQARG